MEHSTIEFVESHFTPTFGPAPPLAEKLVVSPEALIRFKDGKIWVHIGSSAAHAVFDNASVLLLLNAFALPASVNEVKDHHDLNAIDSEKTISALKGIGALLTAAPVSDVFFPNRPGSRIGQYPCRVASKRHSPYRRRFDGLWTAHSSADRG